MAPPIQVFPARREEPGSLDRRIAELAERQHGVVARRQLLALGMSSSAVGRLAGRRLHRVHRGIYAVGHRRLSAKGHLMAAVLFAGPDAALSHVAAAMLWGLRPSAAGRADVIATGAGSGRVRVHRVRGLRPGDLETRDGIRVTSVARTLLDLASMVGEAALVRAWEAAERASLLDVAALAELLERYPTAKGSGPLRRLVRQAREVPETRSELERRFLSFCQRHGLPEPIVNVRFGDWELDAVWPRTQLVVELDSWHYHQTRASFERDRREDLALALAGKIVVRVTSRCLHDERVLARELRQLLARTGGDRSRESPPSGSTASPPRPSSPRSQAPASGR